MGSEKLLEDIIVLLPGIMGSTLRNKVTGDLVWAPSAGAVLRAISTFGASINAMTLPKDIGDGHPGDDVEPVGLMPDLHLLPGLWSANIGYDQIIDWLRTKFHLVDTARHGPEAIPNFLCFPYDWRLSNRYNAKQLKEIVEPALYRWRAQGGQFADAKIVFVCHSMGGLIAQWYIEREGGAAVTRKLITIGTPYRGALKALDQLVNGVKVGIGPLQLNLTAFARSLPSVHQLLPEYACIEGSGGLQKLIGSSVPQLDVNMVADAIQFYDEIHRAAESRQGDFYNIYPLVGFRQNTLASARITDGGIEVLETIEGDEEGGDATVPRFAAVPKGLPLDSPSIHYVPDQHGFLQANQAILDQIEAILTAKPKVYKAAYDLHLGVSAEPVVLQGQPIIVTARLYPDEPVALEATAVNEAGNKVKVQRLQYAGTVQRADLGSLSPGAYTITVSGVGTLQRRVAPITTTVLVWG